MTSSELLELCARALRAEDPIPLLMFNDDEIAALAQAVLAIAIPAITERCAAAVCYGCANGWLRGYHSCDPEHGVLMHKSPGASEFGHPCNASAIRATSPETQT
jgi:hypothetical protein